MPAITIHLTQEQVQELFNNRDITIGVNICSFTNAANESFDSEKSFFDFFQKEIENLKERGQKRTTETYKAAYKKFLCFTTNTQLPFRDVDSKLLEAFQAYLRKQNLSMNTISFHMRILRAVYNKAIEQGLADDLRPFRHVYTGIAKTSKRAISIEELRALRQFTSDDKNLLFARDMFLFSFYTRGMSFVDMAYLKKSDIINDILTYKRHKTGQSLNIRWEKKMQDIVNQYALPSSEYLLPFIHIRNGKERNQYRNCQSKINHNLKIVAKQVAIDQKLTMYCARHTWATIAQQMQIPIEVISRGMGHTNPKTTEIYLKSIDIKAIDQANHQILNSL